jgi:SAM-dependent methyltransferase
VLLRHDNDLFKIEDYDNAPPPGHSGKHHQHSIARLIPGPSVNLASRRVLGRLRVELNALDHAKVLVVGGGRQRAWLDERLGAGNSCEIIYSDIDIGADVDLFCDGHDLPFVDECFDALITTAVLEHVLNPARVAKEILRVLKVGCLLYSELPFMQQVHEGAYDFTRYTLSGHRRLFNGIKEIESGMVAGPGTSLVWAIENFFLAFVLRPFPRQMIKIVVRLLFSWLKYFDYLLANKSQAMDGASCTYLFGNKLEHPISDAEVVARYVGAKHLRHT